MADPSQSGAPLPSSLPFGQGSEAAPAAEDPDPRILDDPDHPLAHHDTDLMHDHLIAVADHDGTEMLHQVFDSMAVNGKITMDQLPFLLVGADVHATPKEIDEAIEEHIPDADDPDGLLDFDQVLALFHQLSNDHHELAPLESVTQVEPQQQPSPWVRLWQWIRDRHRAASAPRRHALERHMKPTTRLLLVILGISCLISAAVVAFSVAFIWGQSIGTVAGHLQRDAQLLHDGMDTFGSTNPVASAGDDMQQLASILGVVIDQLGYVSTRRMLMASMQYEQQLLANLLDGWYEQDSLTTATNNIMLTKEWAQHLLETLTIQDVVDMVDSMNVRMPAGHEILLAQRNATAPNQVAILTQFRFAGECLGPCGSSAAGLAAVLKALDGETGCLFGEDYRPMPVVAGYTFLPSAQVAMVYNIMQSSLRQEFVSPVTSVVNQVNEQTRSGSNISATQGDTQELVIANQFDGQTVITSSLLECATACLLANNLDASLIASAVIGYTGTNETTDYDGSIVLAAFGPLPFAGMGLELKVEKSSFLDTLYVSIGSALDMVNSALDGSQEAQFVTLPLSNDSAAVNGLLFWTNFSFPQDCPPEGCGTQQNTSNFLRLPLVSGASGVMTADDYRGSLVIAGYTGLPFISGAFAVKIDYSEVISQGRTMAGAIADFENTARYASTSTEVLLARRKPGVQVAHSAADYEFVSSLKHGGACPNGTCPVESAIVTAAVNGLTGYAEGPDYRGTDVLGAYTYIATLDLGVVVKEDAMEAELPSIVLALELLGCTVAAVLASMLLLAFLASVLLKSMDHSWDEGKRAIEQEKLAFRTVIESMYPKVVAKRLLAGETQIVYHVPAATVFFSDIYEFTATSNFVTPEALIQFMGYTFGTMDAIGDYYRIYKVKTIGDAYLAVSGLPSSECHTRSPTLDMMLFASCCVQIFSLRFLHPDEGAILDVVVKNVISKASQRSPAGNLISPAVPTRPSSITYSNPKEAPVQAPAEPAAVPQVHCVMRYGMAMGSITAGVLQGKTPLFDIWGKTVNLASRMESTGQPGRVQVSEMVYQTVMALADQPFTFEARHKVFCKGFGHVGAYFLDTCSLPPPDSLLEALHIEPNLGQFFFENPVPGFKMIKKGPVAQSSSQADGIESNSDKQSSRSSNVSGRRVRADADLLLELDAATHAAQ